MTAGRWTARATVGMFAAVLVALTLGTLAFAQRGGGGRGGEGGGDGASFVQLTRMGTLESVFKLTKDQKKRIKTILDEAHTSAAPIRSSLAKTHAAIAVAIQAGQGQAGIDGAVTSYAEQATAMTAMEMTALAQIFQVLDDAQRANPAALRSAFYLMYGIFLDNKNWDEVPGGSRY
jgi:hypothetical protein